MKKILFAFPIILLLAAGCESLQQVPVQNTSPALAITPTATPTTIGTNQTSSDIKFTGTIQEVKNEQPYDGQLSIKVNDKWVIIGGGMMPPNASNGSVTGLDFNSVENNVGKKVEVFATEINPPNSNSLTILGASKYYVKLAQ